MPFAAGGCSGAAAPVGSHIVFAYASLVVRGLLFGVGSVAGACQSHPLPRMSWCVSLPLFLYSFEASVAYPSPQGRVFSGLVGCQVIGGDAVEFGCVCMNASRFSFCV